MARYSDIESAVYEATKSGIIRSVKNEIEREGQQGKPLSVSMGMELFIDIEHDKGRLWYTARPKTQYINMEEKNNGK